MGKIEFSEKKNFFVKHDTGRFFFRKKLNPSGRVSPPGGVQIARFDSTISLCFNLRPADSLPTYRENGDLVCSEQGPELPASNPDTNEYK